jgi:hypothetical protein
MAGTVEILDSDIRVFTSPNDIKKAANMNDIRGAIIERNRIGSVAVNKMKTEKAIVVAIKDINVTLKEISEIKNIIGESDAAKDRDFTGELLIENDVGVKRVNIRVKSVDSAMFGSGNKLRRFGERAVGDGKAAATINSDTSRKSRVMSGITNRDST